MSGTWSRAGAVLPEARRRLVSWGHGAEQRHGTTHVSSGSRLWLWLALAPDTSPGGGVAMAPVLCRLYGDGAGGHREGCSRGWCASANHRLLNPAWCYTAPLLPAPRLGLQQQDFARKGNCLHSVGVYRASQPCSSIARVGGSLEIPLSGSAWPAPASPQPWQEDTSICLLVSGT